MSISRPKFLGIIPARGGSKGIKNKNIRNFAGRPLIYHTIKEAQKSKYLDRIIVSTESQKIAAVAKKYGAEVPFLRPRELAQDRSKVLDAVEHLLNKLKEEENYSPQFVVLLQPTSPLRTVTEIDGIIQLFLKRKADSAITMCATEPRVFAKDKKDGLRLVSSKDFLKSTNRQDFMPTFKEDGSMVYVNRVKTLLAKRNFLGGKLVGYAIPRWRAVDLDEPQDFVVGELIYKNFRKIDTKIKNFK
ncbi:MAG: acylneuraminate cytidylyltransferase family protein [Candidatus Giovannonibacteria bacterium]|nr:acylneuraminate cytidylyltransferase family protein [Candidatus Giovannonibacteria bacterium]